MKPIVEKLILEILLVNSSTDAMARVTPFHLHPTKGWKKQKTTIEKVHFPLPHSGKLYQGDLFSLINGKMKRLKT